MLAAMNVASPPAPEISLRMACPRFSSRSLRTRRAPSRAKTRAAALPIPPPAPVIRATFPSSSKPGLLIVASGMETCLPQKRHNLFAEEFHIIEIVVHSDGETVGSGFGEFAHLF